MSDQLLAILKSQNIKSHRAFCTITHTHTSRLIRVDYPAAFLTVHSRALFSPPLCFSRFGVWRFCYSTFISPQAPPFELINDIKSGQPVRRALRDVMEVRLRSQFSLSNACSDEFSIVLLASFSSPPTRTTLLGCPHNFLPSLSLFHPSPRAAHLQLCVLDRMRAQAAERLSDAAHRRAVRHERERRQ
jgi:hypothetical protein